MSLKGDRQERVNEDEKEVPRDHLLPRSVPQKRNKGILRRDQNNFCRRNKNPLKEKKRFLMMV